MKIETQVTTQLAEELAQSVFDAIWGDDLQMVENEIGVTFSNWKEQWKAITPWESHGYTCMILKHEMWAQFDKLWIQDSAHVEQSSDAIDWLLDHTLAELSSNETTRTWVLTIDWRDLKVVSRIRSAHPIASIPQTPWFSEDLQHTSLTVKLQGFAE